MQGQTKERWRELCEQVVMEKDSARLMALVEEIVQLVREMQESMGAANHTA